MIKSVHFEGSIETAVSRQMQTLLDKISNSAILLLPVYFSGIRHGKFDDDSLF